MSIRETAISNTTANSGAVLAVLFAVVVFAGEAVALRAAGKHGIPLGPIAVTQCAVAASIQLILGARFSRVDWRRWWPALLTSTFAGMAFYIAIRVAPAALVGMIEPLGLVPLMAGHRLLLKKRLTISCALSLLMLVAAGMIAVGQWPERVGLFAIAISCVGIVCSGLSLVTGEAVSSEGLPSFVFAMQFILMIFAGVVGFGLESTSLAGRSGMLFPALGVGAGIGLFVGLAVMALYYGVLRMGALRAGSIKMLRLPGIALLAYLVVNESASIVSAIALVAVALFSILAVRLSSKDENLPSRRQI